MAAEWLENISDRNYVVNVMPMKTTSQFLTIWGGQQKA